MGRLKPLGFETQQDVAAFVEEYIKGFYPVGNRVKRRRGEWQRSGCLKMFPVLMNTFTGHIAKMGKPYIKLQMNLGVLGLRS